MDRGIVPAAHRPVHADRRRRAAPRRQTGRPMTRMWIELDGKRVELGLPSAFAAGVAAGSFAGGARAADSVSGGTETADDPSADPDTIVSIITGTVVRWAGRRRCDGRRRRTGRRTRGDEDGDPDPRPARRHPAHVRSRRCPGSLRRPTRARRVGIKRRRSPAPSDEGAAGRSVFIHRRGSNHGIGNTSNKGHRLARGAWPATAGIRRCRGFRPRPRRTSAAAARP